MMNEISLTYIIASVKEFDTDMQRWFNEMLGVR